MDGEDLVVASCCFGNWELGIRICVCFGFVRCDVFGEKCLGCNRGSSHVC